MRGAWAQAVPQDLASVLGDSACTDEAGRGWGLMGPQKDRKGYFFFMSLVLESDHGAGTGRGRGGRNPGMNPYVCFQQRAFKTEARGIPGGPS